MTDTMLELTQRGYVEIEHDALKPGTRVRNRGHQWPEAFDSGTAVVVAVMEKVNSAWAQGWGARDIEVVIKADDGIVSAWANYGTRAVSE